MRTRDLLPGLPSQLASRPPCGASAGAGLCGSSGAGSPGGCHFVAGRQFAASTLFVSLQVLVLESPASLVLPICRCVEMLHLRCCVERT